MTDLVDDIAQYLQAQGVGTVDVNIFEGVLPADPDSAVAIIRTLGLKPTIDAPIGAPSFQVLVRSTDYGTGQMKFDLLKTLLHNQYNLQFVPGGVYFYYCQLISDGGHLGQDQIGRDLFSMNFECKTR